MSPSNLPISQKTAERIVENIEGDFDDLDPIEFLGRLDAAVKRTKKGEGAVVGDIEEFIESL